MNKSINPSQPTDWLTEIKFDENGLIPVIAQDYKTNVVLMMAWMDKLALQETIRLSQAVYYSRSRKKLWHKGEQSGHFQHVHDILLDCDSDVILIKVEQVGGIACHTGRQSCFYRKFIDNQWQTTEPVIKDPNDIYKSTNR